MITDRPSRTASLTAGAIRSEPNECWHAPIAHDAVVAVIGAGKMGLPLCAQYAHHGWRVIAVDSNPEVVSSINRGRSHIGDEPDVDMMIKAAVDAGKLSATDSIEDAVSKALVVVVIIPISVDHTAKANFKGMDKVVHSIGKGVQQGATVIFETTVPVGTTRNRYTPILESESGMTADEDFFVAFSPERVSSGSVLESLAIYPKLVGGIGESSGRTAGFFYDSVLDAEIVVMTSSEAAECAKLVDTTYRDVNIALANEFADIADDLGLDVQEIIAAANSQPYSHVHQPGIGVGGHCIPVYPRLLMQSTKVDTILIRTARNLNVVRPGMAVLDVRDALGEPNDLVGYSVLVLGLTYREGVKEMAFSPGLELVEGFKALGATVHAWDPLLTDKEVRSLGAEAWTWGNTLGVDAIITATADPDFQALYTGWFPNLSVIYDGRNSLRELSIPEGVEYIGVGVNAKNR